MKAVTFMVALSLAFLSTVAVTNAADDWIQKSPASKPSAREYHSLAYIGSDLVLLFGGWDGSRDDETWLYDLSNNTWTQQSPGLHPSPRRLHDMAYIGEDKVLLFGGETLVTDDTLWIYDLSEDEWTARTPGSAPSYTYVSHRLVYIGGDQVLMFGGHDGYNYSDSTWLYDLSDDRWTQQSPSVKPSPRSLHDMVYLGGDKVLLFGGYDGSHYDDTWVYDLSDDNWTQQNPAVKPSARRHHAMAYIGEDQVLLFGGHDGSDFNDETWVYDLSDDNWTQDLNSTQPSARFGHALSETSLDGSSYPVLFGGYDGSRDDETWTFGGGDYLVPDPPQVTVTYPNGGETLEDSVTITWTASDPDPGETALLLADLEYSESAGSTWSIIDTGQVNDGTYFWDISGLYVYGGTDYLIRITVTDTTGLFDCDTSDAIFTIDNPIPRIVSISDVPNDQGRKVLILWDRSYLDAPEYQVITYYSIWRRHLGGSKIELIGTEWDGTLPEDLTQPVYRRTEWVNASGETKTEYWEYIGSVDAHYFEGYAYIAPTLEDSSASGIPYFTFLVSAQTADPFVFWDSAPDSGYSVDNINPAKTQIGILASWSAKGSVNTIWLSWDQVTTGVDGSPEQGPIDYRIYCEENPDFTPGPGNLLTTVSGLRYPHTDSRIGDPAANLFYLVTVIDGSDNESAVSNRVGEFDRSLVNLP